MQWPGPGVMQSSKSFHASHERFPARRSAQNFQTSDPEATVSPLHVPRIIGPPGMMIAGRSTIRAPIRSPGIVLSQPPINTAASIG